MLREEITEIKIGREMDALIAVNVMGWVPAWGNWWLGLQFGEFNCQIGKASNWMAEAPESHGVEYRGKNYWSHHSTVNWKPSLSIENSYEVEGRIEELGLQEKYSNELCKITGVLSGWGLIHATPEQRCKAALIVCNK